MTPDELYLLHERIAIKCESGIPEDEAERQARAELFLEPKQDLLRLK